MILLRLTKVPARKDQSAKPRQKVAATSEGEGMRNPSYRPKRKTASHAATISSRKIHRRAYPLDHHLLFVSVVLSISSTTPVNHRNPSSSRRLRTSSHLSPSCSSSLSPS